MGFSYFHRYFRMMGFYTEFWSMVPNINSKGTEWFLIYNVCNKLKIMNKLVFTNPLQ